MFTIVVGNSRNWEGAFFDACSERGILLKKSKKSLLAAFSSCLARCPYWLKLLGLGIVVFFFLTLFSTSASFGFEKKFGRDPLYSKIFLDHIGRWLPWVFMVPVLGCLEKRFPFTRDTWGWVLGMHLVLSVLWLPLYLFLVMFFEFVRGSFDWPIFLAQYKRYFGINMLGDYQWYWIVLVAVTAWRFGKDLISERQETAALLIRNSQLQKNLAESQLEILKGQIQPHFLYNTHHAIGALIRRDQPKKALKVLNLLSKLLRGSLERSVQQMSRLGEEMEFVEDYLTIQKIRFPESLSISISVEEQCRNAQIPAMVLQPLVENAVCHGLASEQEGDTIQIKVSQQSEKLLVTVSNKTGPQSKDSSGFGLGLKNTRSRLHHLYGDEHSLELEYLDERTICATLVLPFRM